MSGSIRKHGTTVAVAVFTVVVVGTLPAIGHVTTVNHSWNHFKPKADALFWKEGGDAGTVAGTDFLGTTDDEPLELKVFGQRALRLEPTAGSPNVIGGFNGNNVTAPALGATIGGGGDGGSVNRITDDYGTIAGGLDNRVGNDNVNTTDNRYATVAGGQTNTASGIRSFIGGGVVNTATADNATVAGGISNDATNASATVAGGTGNLASGVESFVGGGDSNTATADNATVAGGFSNDATAQEATIGGGSSNTADDLGATVGGGSSNISSDDYTTVSGGQSNQAIDFRATVGGGGSNIANGNNALVSGGNGNEANATSSTIGGGFDNTASAQSSFVPGGSQALASLEGQMAHASGQFATLGDAQTSEFVLRGETSGTTAEDLFLDGLVGKIVLVDGRTIAFQALVVGRETNAGGEGAGYLVSGVIENVSGTPTLIATATTALGEDDAAWTAVAQADTGADTLDINVVANTGDTVRWVATVWTSEVLWTA